MAGLAFPFTDAAIEAIQATFKNEKTNYVQLSIDMNKEIVNLKSQSTCTVHELPEKVPEDAPRYHLFRFNHTYEGDFLKSTGKYKRHDYRVGLHFILGTDRHPELNFVSVILVFIFTMPGYNCSIKERMLYASCRNTVIETIEALGVEIIKKVRCCSLTSRGRERWAAVSVTRMLPKAYYCPIVLLSILD